MSRKHASKRWRLLLVAISAFYLAVSLPVSIYASESGEFNGTWIANGTRTNFPFSADRKIHTFSLSGHVNLQTSLGKEKDYWSDCVGLSDSTTGIIARCVWEDLDGTELYLTLQSEKWQEATPFTGNIVGGSGRLQGIVGELSFTWSSFIVLQEESGSTASGQTLDLHGSYQIP
jgi:hypothetical protein